MSKIDVHADDYGLTMNTSVDILKGVLNGKLNSISVTPNTTCFEKARDYFFEKLSNQEKPAISVHLNFMEGYCCGNKEELKDLTDEEGLFKISWGDLVKYNYHPGKRAMVKEQLKKEIKVQLWKVIDGYELLKNGKLRVDSHQHTHMIPIVMDALLEVIQEEKLPIEYIRISKETWSVYLKKISFYPTYRLINLIKVMVLNWYAIGDEKKLKKYGIPTMLLSGVFLSGKMDEERVKTLLPDLKKVADKKGITLEVLFHPGTALSEEVGKEFNNPDANKFYLSPNRQVEFQAVMSLVNTQM